MEAERNGLHDRRSTHYSKLKLNKIVKLPKKRDVYESFILKGLVSEMSYFTITALCYSAAKLALGTFYYNDCSLEPRLLVYLLFSSVLMLLYLPWVANLGEDKLGIKPYNRLIIGIQLFGLSFGTYLLYGVYARRQELSDVAGNTCNDVIFRFTAASIAFEWMYISFTLFSRGFVTILFHLVVFLLKSVFKILLTCFHHEKEKTS